jgi:multidrug efflux pump subunit AcrB
LTTVAGFMPLLLFSGGDFWPPLAIVIAGGVGLSGLLSLVLTPAAYRLIHLGRQGKAISNRLPVATELTG